MNQNPHVFSKQALLVTLLQSLNILFDISNTWWYLQCCKRNEFWVKPEATGVSSSFIRKRNNASTETCFIAIAETLTHYDRWHNQSHKTSTESRGYFDRDWASRFFVFFGCLREIKRSRRSMFVSYFFFFPFCLFCFLRNKQKGWDAPPMRIHKWLLQCQWSVETEIPQANRSRNGK